QRPGATPRSAVWQRDAVTLYRYEPAPPAGVPLLIVYALVNRPDMVDLQADRSLVRALIAHGFDVYLLDWGTPGPADRTLGLEAYVNGYLDAAVDWLRATLDRPAVPLMGICQGGTFSLCYAALNPDKVERLVTTVTPVDFQTPDDMLSHLVRHIDVEALVDAYGNLDGDVLNALFLSLKPFQLMQQKYLRLVDVLDDPAATAMFLRMEQWIFDSPALTAQACRECARDLYQSNRLARGTLALGGRTVRLERLTMPLLNVWARDDHLVPPAASRALAELVPAANYREHELPGGHIGIYVGRTEHHALANVLAGWMQER
ncbi:MAG: class III poly(R)-hydroxyalkanoic acid synthase subunit PhaC, partial [Gammaproteobacteria bacterium]